MAGPSNPSTLRPQSGGMSLWLHILSDQGPTGHKVRYDQGSWEPGGRGWPYQKEPPESLALGDLFTQSEP